MSRSRTPRLGFAARLIVLSLVLAACGATVRPSTTPGPTPSRPAATVAPSSGPFVAGAYPPEGDAPCGQDEAPNAKHAAYRGNLKRITAKDPATVVFELCRPDVAFLARIAAPAFAINDAGWLAAHVDPKGGADQAIVSEVNGTGPYRLERWDRGSEVSLARYDGYWGTPARNERVIVRWRDSAAQRLVELQGAIVDGIDELDPTGSATAEQDVNLRFETRTGLNVLYLGFTSTFEPFDDERVRRAIAMGIDRRRIVDGFLPAGSDVASYYAPCVLAGACTGSAWHAFDPLQGKELLAAAGFPDGFDTVIRYRAAARPYLPDPAAVAEDVRTQLFDNLGIRATLAVEPEDTFPAALAAGELDGIHLTSQAVSYPDVAAVLDPRFGGGSKEFGPPFTDIGKALASGRATIDPGARAAAYGKANDAIVSHAPMIPIAHVGSAAAFRGDVEGAGSSPLRLERFAAMTPGDRRQLVWLTTAEPGGLYCADETDAVAGLVCAQLSEGLYAYDPAGTTPTPALARSCQPNKDLTVWTCVLRPGVRFHDGATLDSNDVLVSFAAQWDAEHPLHAGRTGRFDRMNGWFGGFLNPPSRTP